MIFLVVLAFASASSFEDQAAVTPVQKVIQLLQGMRSKGQQEKKEEQVMFAAYKQWCDDTSTEKQRDIQEANMAIEQLQASIQMAESEAAELGRSIEEIDGMVSGWNLNQKSATEVRDKEKADYLATHRDYSESVDALGRAITVLKRQAFDRSQAQQALMQVQESKLIPPHAGQVITAFLAEGDAVEQDPLDVTAPEANAYEFQSGGVVDMLEKLKDKFQDERTDLEKEEMNARHAYEMLMQDLTDQIEHANEERSRKVLSKTNKLENAASEKGDLKDVQSQLASDSEYLSGVTTTCQAKSSDFEQRQELRGEEIEAIDKALEILSGSMVTGHAEKYLPSMVQTSLAFLASTSDRQKQVAEFLEKRGTAIQSHVLLAIASKVSDDPFSKVKKMIKDLIVHLMEEANEEAEHKGWCDTELAENKQTRDEKSAQVDVLHAKVDKLTATIAKLGQELGDLAMQIAEVNAAVEKATAQRAKETEVNTQTIKDAQEAQTALAQATTVLKEFYAKANTATALVQSNTTSFLQQPEIFDSAYTGMQSSTGGVVGMLEVIQSDFARLETETKTTETENQTLHDRFLAESAKNKAVMEKDQEHKERKKTNDEGDLNTAKSDLRSTQGALDAALAYYDKLKPACVDAGVTYEDRVSRRKEEIESLQEALKILNGEDIA